jgi:hypothetical protein
LVDGRGVCHRYARRRRGLADVLHFCIHSDQVGGGVWEDLLFYRCGEGGNGEGYELFVRGEIVEFGGCKRLSDSQSKLS